MSINQSIILVLGSSHRCDGRGRCFLTSDNDHQALHHVHHYHQALYHKHLHQHQHHAYLVSSSLTPWLILLAPSTANMTGTQSWPAANRVDGPTWSRCSGDGSPGGQSNNNKKISCYEVIWRKSMHWNWYNFGTYPGHCEQGKEICLQLHHLRNTNTNTSP